MATVGVKPEECRMGRAAMGLTVAELAEAAGLSQEAVVAFESGAAVAPDVSLSVASALAAIGVTFYMAPDGRSRMRAMTLDGIIEAPVTLSQR